jgi:hypothetical protein
VKDPEVSKPLENTYGCDRAAGGFIEVTHVDNLTGTHEFSPDFKDSQFGIYFSSLTLTVTAQNSCTAKGGHFKDCPVGDTGDAFCHADSSPPEEHQGPVKDISCAIKMADSKGTSGTLTLEGTAYPFSFDGHQLDLNVHFPSGDGIEFLLLRR